MNKTNKNFDNQITHSFNAFTVIDDSAGYCSYSNLFIILTTVLGKST